jgi:hypothetical protein
MWDLSVLKHVAQKPSGRRKMLACRRLVTVKCSEPEDPDRR